MNSGLTEAVFAAAGATWPPESTFRDDFFLFREGGGGGKRVSAASVLGDVDPPALARAETWFRKRGEQSLFLIGETAADACADRLLAACGYDRVDPVTAFAASLPLPVGETPMPDLHFTWPPTAAMRSFWAAAGIGPARLAVMARVKTPKTVVAAYARGRIAGLGFAGVLGGVAILHALAVAPELRRQGIGRSLVMHAGRWAQDHAAETLALMVTADNSPAVSLYTGLSFRPVGRYHYRQQKTQAES